MRGRKSLFKTHMIEEAEKLAEMGLTNEEIADFWGRSRRAFQYWLNKYPEFLHILKRAKLKADKEIEKKLFQRALGYEYKEMTEEKRGGTLVLTKVVTKQQAPDVVAQIFWLKNRRPDLWRDVQHKVHSGGIVHQLREKIGGYLEEHGEDGIEQLFDNFKRLPENAGGNGRERKPSA